MPGDRGGTAKVSEVGWSKTQDTPPDQGTNTEYDPLLEGQPVKYIKHVGCYVSSFRNVSIIEIHTRRPIKPKVILYISANSSLRRILSITSEKAESIIKLFYLQFFLTHNRKFQVRKVYSFVIILSVR